MAREEYLLIIQNKKLNLEYFVIDSIEAGMKLYGSEIKSIRDKKININDAFITFKGRIPMLTNAHISKYSFSNIFNHIETRPRELLLHKSEITKLLKKIKEGGFTLVPSKVYIKEGIAKIEICLCKGKKNYDKRQDLKEKDEKRYMDKIVKGKY
ncbi:MAG: SsrA-binding protein SmpB [Acholeplasmatales bacterium]|jgi:SsrA-binding protein|nr:SsrA-binding protein SmpB [Acholeplasmatales bacterium]